MREVLVHVVAQVLLHEWRHGEAADVRDDERVAVRIGMRDVVHRDVAAAPALVLDHERLAEGLLHLRGEAARHDTARAAGCERHDQADGLRRIVLRPERLSYGEQKGEENPHTAAKP